MISPRDERGSALLVTLVVTVVLAILGSSLLAVTSNNYQMNTSIRHRTQALYIAEGGAESAYARLRSDPAYRATQSAHQVQVGSANATVSIVMHTSANAPTYYIITSRGTVRNSTVQVVLRVSELDLGIFENAIYARGDIKVGNNARVFGGDVAVRGDLYKKSGNDWVKNIAAITVDAGRSVATGVDLPFPEFPTYDPSIHGAPLTPVAEKGGGNWLTLTLPTGGSGIYWVDSTVGSDSENNVRIVGNGVVFINGDLRAKNNLKFIGDLVVHVKGDISAKNNTETAYLETEGTEGGSTTIIVGGTMQTNNSSVQSKYEGSIIVRGDVIVTNNLTVQYVRPADKELPEGTTKRWVRAWVR